MAVDDSGNMNTASLTSEGSISIPKSAVHKSFQCIPRVPISGNVISCFSIAPPRTGNEIAPVAQSGPFLTRNPRVQGTIPDGIIGVQTGG